jgi:hypothetical protein
MKDSTGNRVIIARRPTRPPYPSPAAAPLRRSRGWADGLEAGHRTRVPSRVGWVDGQKAPRRCRAFPSPMAHPTRPGKEQSTWRQEVVRSRGCARTRGQPRRCSEPSPAAEPAANAANRCRSTTRARTAGGTPSSSRGGGRRPSPADGPAAARTAAGDRRVQGSALRSTGPRRADVRPPKGTGRTAPVPLIVPGTNRAWTSRAGHRSANPAGRPRRAGPGRMRLPRS